MTIYMSIQKGITMIFSSKKDNRMICRNRYYYFVPQGSLFWRREPLSMNMSTFKRDLLRLFDSMYKEVFNFGLKRLTIDVIGNKIMIIGEHSRLPGLNILDKSNRFVTRMTDIALLDECKIRLKEKIEDNIQNVKVSTVLNDYDPATEIAVTVIVTERKLQEIFNE